ncbi:MAG: YafY family transcriptional regulator [Clostridia bacterium]|nr:YafY family transcriptional regulator [Clostridia bacterium]
MIEILIMLLSGKKVSASQIADKYEVCVRSVYRYINELSLCGIPLEVTRGRYGGIRIADTYRLPAGFFTREEYSAMLNAINAMLSQVGDKNLSSAQEKLSIQQKTDKRELAVCGNIIIDGGTWGGSQKFYEKMRICEQAVNQSKCLIIDYISRDGEHSKRVIDPHVLIFKQNIWYVYAFCHTKQTFRTFKIGRIKSASFTGASFEKHEFTKDDINLNFSGYSDKMIEVTFGIEKSSLADVEDWLGIDNIEPRGDGFIANLLLPDDGGLVDKILGFGGKVKVLEPQSLKERVKLAAKNICDN